MFPLRTWAFPWGKYIVLQENFLFPWGTIMSLGRKNLSCFGEQLKPFFPLGKNHVLEEKEPKLPWGAT